MILLLIAPLVILRGSSLAAEFEDNFKNCNVGVPGFDSCIREGMNAIRPYFKVGLPKYNVAPFDPFFAEEVTVRRGLPRLGFTLTLKNVTESGWSVSKVTQFVSDLPDYRVRYTQSFPEKALAGDYEFSGQLLGSEMSNKGKFSLILYDLVQTTTITRAPNEKLRVRVEVQTIRDLALHMTNLVAGRALIEGILDRIINGAWEPGFVMMRPLINDLVSTAFTEIFGKAFQTFPFERIFKPKPDPNATNTISTSATTEP